MTIEVWGLIAGAIVLVLLAWAVWTRIRLRRLENRVERAWSTLALQLQRRAALAEEIARDHPAVVGADRAPYLRAFAVDARAPRDGDREMAENLLGRELRELHSRPDALPPALRADLEGTTTRVGLARHFFNDAVRDLQALRRSRATRLLGVHAGRPMPRFFDIDDRPGVRLGEDGADRHVGRRPYDRSTRSSTHPRGGIP